MKKIKRLKTQKILQQINVKKLIEAKRNKKTL
ncbi:hypothetical protein J2S74_004754 [Evansella vedderi]|uniref:Uncharacterized protein n=1 Tax=Evansella vedderi TaxID=38282 RepID=A0ABU0A1D5_9BACI|nr:hypothetical protein [Evansella vedderi]